MNKSMIMFAFLLTFGLTACKNGDVKKPDSATSRQSDSIAAITDSVGATTKEVKQYDAEGRRTGFWMYEEYGWLKKEHYTDGMLDGHATYSDKERINQIERTRIEMNYCKGIECGEIKAVYMNGNKTFDNKCNNAVILRWGKRIFVSET